jgi:serine/threonine protein kinase/tetratricopeptide (TPR) repeat protein
MLGTTISHYRVIARLGSGGMGVVYRAEDTRLGREVALKCLPPEVATNQQMVERLVQEARSASSLNHPNICTIYEVDEADGHHFITMELLEGETVRERIREGQIPTDELVRIGVQIADALDAAHKKAVIHRDIKPANVFLTRRGEVKVLDFGLAKLETPKAAATAAGVTAAGTGNAVGVLTSPGQTVGTIAYMSPEQARGQKLDVRSDLFSLGVVLYEMATAELPFPGATSALIFDSILNREPVPLSRYNSSLPPAFCNIVTKLLEKECRLRYQSASDVVADLRRLQRDRGPVKAGHAATPTASKAGKTVDSLVVLPFADATGEPKLAYLGDAIAEGVIDGLSHLPKLRVVPRSKAFRLRDHADDPQLVARELAVRAVLTGRITLRGELLSVRAEMIDVAKDTQLWGSQFSCSANEVLGVQEEIARLVAERLRGPSTAGSKKATRKSSPAPLQNEAYELFGRGNDQVIQWTPDGLQRGIEFYQQAIDADPRYAPAYACMAIAHAMLTAVSRIDTAQALGHAKTYARQAIELDEALSEAHAALCLTELFRDFNLSEALWHGERALELNPDSAIARYAYAQTLSACGRLDEAIEHAREGCAIDPLMAPIHYCYGLLLYYQRRWDESAAQLQHTLEIHPDFLVASAVRGIVLARLGRFLEARAQFTDLLNRDPDPVWELLLAYVDALAGEREQAGSILAQVDCATVADGAYFAATIYGALGELDKGFAELERARDVGFAVLATAAVNPALDPFRSDPRWEPFLRSIEELAHAIQELQGTE